MRLSLVSPPLTTTIVAATTILLFVDCASAWIPPSQPTAITKSRVLQQQQQLPSRYPQALPLPRRSCSCSTQHPSRSTDTTLYISKTDDDNDDSNTSSPTTSLLERLQVAGVSVSPKGFHVIMQRATVAPSNGDVSDNAPPPPASPKFLALKVTNDPTDAFAATSPESLTLCQLLSGVDMAGAILPPELLSKLVVYHTEEKQQQQQQQQQQQLQLQNDSNNMEQQQQQVSLQPPEQAILDALQESLQKTSQDSFKDAHVWFQHRMALPQITLDQLTLAPTTTTTTTTDTTSSGTSQNSKTTTTLRWQCRLECALPEWKERLVLPCVDDDILSSLAFQYDPDSSLLFTCIALALRYKAPIVLEQGGDEETTALVDRYSLTVSELEEQFPKRTTVGKLQQQSTRVAENIERGFEIHKLQGALTIAMKMGDQEAAKKIRAKLDEYDSMQDLPTIATTTTTTTTASVNPSQEEPNDNGMNDEERLDDLDKNILQ